MAKTLPETLISFLQEHPNRVYSANALVQLPEFREYGSRQIGTALSHIRPTTPQLDRVRRGFYQWVPNAPAGAENGLAATTGPDNTPSESFMMANVKSKAIAPDKSVSDEMLVSVVTRSDSRILVRDDETGILYILTPFKF